MSFFKNAIKSIMEMKLALNVTPPSERRKGFTLIELSIVLVIIGLIVGGVLVGRDLINAAQVRGAIRDVDKIKASINTFRVKYDCLPGDCKNATTFFSNLADIWYWSSPGNLKNGDGNDQYDQVYEGSPRLWEHLSAAGLWNGPVGVMANGGNGGLVPGINIPSFSWFKPFITNSANPGYSITAGTIYAVYGHMYFPDWASSWESGQDLVVNKYTWVGKNRLALAGWNSSAERPSPWGGLNCNVQWDIDTKLDDGLPNTGGVRSYGTTDSCSGWDYKTGVPPATGYTYDFTSTSKTGVLLIDQ